MSVIANFDTTRGPIKVELFADKAPLTVANFVNLAKRGFYDGLKFHRVINDFMVQGGCPQGTGTGGPGYRFEDETKNGLSHERGVLSMANAGPGTNGSQFFITHVPCPWLDGKHTVFGKVLEGQQVVDSVKQGDTIRLRGQGGRGIALDLQRLDHVALLDRVDHVHTFDDLAEDGVLAIEPRRSDVGDEELAAVGVRAGVGHRQDAGPIVPQ